MIALRNIAVATDFGEASDAAVNYGLELARTLGARLHLLHVVEPPFLESAARGIDIAMIQAELQESARERLQNLMTPRDRRELRAVAATRTDARPAQAIARYAKDAHVDLLIVGTHGRCGIAHMVMGSVAEKVVRMAECPVLTVRNQAQPITQASVVVQPLEAVAI